MCRECFYAAFEDEVHHTIFSAGLFKQGDKIAIGASGGKGLYCCSWFGFYYIFSKIVLPTNLLFRGLSTILDENTGHDYTIGAL